MHLFNYLPFPPPHRGHWTLLEKASKANPWDGGCCSLHEFQEVPRAQHYSVFLLYTCHKIFVHDGDFKSPFFLNIWPYHPAFSQQLTFHHKWYRNHHLRSTTNSHYWTDKGCPIQNHCFLFLPIKMKGLFLQFCHLKTTSKGRLFSWQPSPTQHQPLETTVPLFL